ncbi:tRNA modification GTPase MnmE [Bienertia sinuspersici]
MDVRSNIMSGGPWSIQGLKPLSVSIEKSQVWMNLSKLPIKFFEKSILRKVGDQIGSTIKIDANTLEGGERIYAGVYVLVKENTNPPSGALYNIFGHASRAYMRKKIFVSNTSRERRRSRIRKKKKEPKLGVKERSLSTKKLIKKPITSEL